MNFRNSWAALTAIFLTTMVQAQQTYVSSLSATAGTRYQFGASGLAFNFTTDAVSYSLSSVTVNINTLQAGITLTGSLFLADGQGRPTGSALATNLTASDPGYPNNFADVVFATSGVTLAPSTR